MKNFLSYFTRKPSRSNKDNDIKHLDKTFIIKENDDLDEVKETDLAIQVTKRKLSKCFIEKVPSELFPIIQDYLIDKDYAYLVSTNKFIFQIIRKQTIRFTVKIENNNRPRYYDNGLTILENLQRQGYNPYKQIRLKVYDFTNDLTNSQRPSNLPSMTGYYSLLIDYSFARLIQNNIDFHTFQGNQHVIITSLKRTTRLIGTIHNIYSITIECCRELLEIVDSSSSSSWNGDDNKLNRIRIDECGNLMTIPRIHNVEDIFIHKTNIHSLSITGTKLKSFHFDFNCVRKMISFDWMHADLFMNLQKLYLRGIFPKEIDSSLVKAMMKVSNVTLISQNVKSIDQPLLSSIFLGRKLELHGFNISMWNEQCLPNARSITLLNSFQLTHLPDLPQANHVTLKNLHELQFLPLSLPVCRRFEIDRCHSVVRLPCLANLSSIVITSCDSLSDISLLKDLMFQSVSIKQCPALLTVTPFRNAHVLDISGCTGVTSFKDFDQSLLPAQERTFSLMTCKNVRDFSGLGHIRELNLFMLDGLTDGGGIHDVEMLNVMMCSNVTKITNIHNVKSVNIT